MPSVAHLTPFTSETGRQAQLKSARVLRELVENGKKHLTLATEKITGLTEIQSEVARQIELTEEQLTHTRNELNRMSQDTYGFCKVCKRHGVDGKERAALLRELRGLMEHLCRLRGIGEPARTRPTNELPRTRNMPRPEPTPSIVQQAPALPIPALPQSSTPPVVPQEPS